MAAGEAIDKFLADASRLGFNTWVACAIPLALLTYATVFCRLSPPPGKWAILLPSSITGVCLLWLSAISKVVPEPYLDEVFHIPQAQRYCFGRILEWDDKITTPPGLYLLSNLLPQAAKATVPNWARSCDTDSLRAVNAIGLFVSAYIFLLCRRQIEARASREPLLPFTGFAFHSACNVALFPLLFFFSGLYYTDVTSTAVVLVAFFNHLNRVAGDRSSMQSNIFTVGLGLLALLMRQTNIFWIVVYMGGLEAVHAVKSLRPETTTERDHQPVGLWEQLRHNTWRSSIGHIHDPPLCLAGPDDPLFTAVSLAVVMVCNPGRVLRQIWPYISVLGAFCAFVAWNGGVVLGDKSNHVATVHLAQMLYIWPFFAFFSLPLLLPQALTLSNALKRFLTCNPATGRTNQSQSGEKPKGGDARPGPKLVETSIALQMAESFRILIWPIFCLGTLALSYAVVRYNTIIHPFTLADNRHYMFYVFRYTIRRATWIRYLLLVPYTISRFVVWGTVAGRSEGKGGCQGTRHACHGEVRPSSSTNQPTGIARGAKKKPSEAVVCASGNGREAREATERKLGELLQSDPLRYSTEPACMSTGLLFLMATALSLVTAPLVEPRYFILPWVMWRLLVPAWRPGGHGSSSDFSGAAGCQSQPCLGKVVEHFRRHDVWLIGETIWFFAINLATCYVFLAKPYVWRDENGGVLDDGRLQRFMW